jgi:hypothetical protein
METRLPKLELTATMRPLVRRVSAGSADVLSRCYILPSPKSARKRNTDSRRAQSSAFYPSDSHSAQRRPGQLGAGARGLSLISPSQLSTALSANR